MDKFSSLAAWEQSALAAYPKAWLWFNERTGEHSLVYGGIERALFSECQRTGWVEREIA